MHGQCARDRIKGVRACACVCVCVCWRVLDPPTEDVRLDPETVVRDTCVCVRVRVRVCASVTPRSLWVGDPVLRLRDSCGTIPSIAERATHLRRTPGAGPRGHRDCVLTCESAGLRTGFFSHW